MSRALYLKINRAEDYALKNLSRWIDASYLMSADCYIICDDNNLQSTILNNMLIYRDITFIKSEKSEEIKYLVSHIANRNWINAAYAHLTSFWHACGKYEFFWNVDADDTRLCVSIDRMAEILQRIEEYAEEHKIDCFSLDMWRSETYGRHWSFGVTYVNGKIDWLGLCREKCQDKGYFQLDNEGNQNIDWFFTYLKQSTKKKIETFYIENLRFIHYSNDFFDKPIGSGMYHWKNGKLVYPIAYYGLGIDEIGKYDIADDVIKFDFNIADCEASGMLAYYAREGKDLSSFYKIEEIINEKISKKKFEVFKKKHGYTGTIEPQIICFGAGNALKKNITKIKKIYDLKYVCDNDSSKWGKKVSEGISCISPDDLANLKNAIVVILVYSKQAVSQIAEQLSLMKIDYDYMDNWLACIE